MCSYTNSNGNNICVVRNNPFFFFFFLMKPEERTVVKYSIFFIDQLKISIFKIKHRQICILLLIQFF